jgi:hypothetical protein
MRPFSDYINRYDIQLFDKKIYSSNYLKIVYSSDTNHLIIVRLST